MALVQESYSVLQYLEQELADIRAATEQRKLLDMCCLGMPQTQPPTDINQIILDSVKFTPECLDDSIGNSPHSNVNNIDKAVDQIVANYESFIMNLKMMDRQRNNMPGYVNNYDSITKQYNEYFLNLQNTFDISKQTMSDAGNEAIKIGTNFDDSQKPCDCPICGYKCQYEAIYHQHMQNHATSCTQAKYSCSECDYTCERKKTFDSHMESHNTHPLLECRQCTYKNISRHQFMVHVYQTGHKCYKCNECGEIFKFKIDLQLHLKNHILECPTCKQSFTRPELKNHMWTHTEKPLQCTECDYKCITNARLKRHMQTHTENKPFVCSVCCRRFSTKYSLKRHSLIHSAIKEKSFKCNECGSNFTYKNGLTYHLKVSGHRKNSSNS